MGNKLDNPRLELPPEKLVMVTGGNTGIGYETAKSVAEMGAKVCIACRSENKAKAAIERMQTEHRDEVQKRRLAQVQGQPSAQRSTDEVEVKPLNVEYIKLDLSSLQSTMDFIQETKQRMQSLNILVCNAGIAFAKQGYTGDNFESHFQVNYLSHLLIAIHLMPLLRAGAPDARIIFLSSAVHSSGQLDLDNMQSRKSYSRITAYGSSKAYMVMATNFLARRLEGTGVSTFSIDPGMVNTDILYNSSDWRLLSFLAGAASKLGMMRTPKQGAATSVTASVDPNLCGKTGVFMKNCRPATPARFCCDEANQETLWDYSLGCLDKFISDHVLKEAFPSARPDLLTIPKDTRTVEEKIADDLPKQGGSSDDKETEEQPREGGASPEKKQLETQPEKELSAAVVEVPPESSETSPEPKREKSAEDEVQEDAPREEKKEGEASSEEQRESGSSAVASPEIDKTQEEPKVENEKSAEDEIQEEPEEDSSKIASETSTGGEGLSEGQVEERPTGDGAPGEDSSAAPPDEQVEEPSPVVTEEDISIIVEDGKEKPMDE